MEDMKKKKVVVTRSCQKLSKEAVSQPQLSRVGLKSSKNIGNSVNSREDNKHEQMKIESLKLL